MMWPFRRRQPKPSPRALAALRDAERREERIERVVRAHEELRRRNRFAEQIEMTLRGSR